MAGIETQVVMKDGLDTVDIQVTKLLNSGWELSGEPYAVPSGIAQFMVNTGKRPPDPPAKYKVLKKVGLDSVAGQIIQHTSQGWDLYGKTFYVGGVETQAITFGVIFEFEGDTPRSVIMTWAMTQAFQAVTVNRDANGAIVSANIVWPDGVPGVFVTDKASDLFPGAVDAWHATYLNKTLRQPAVTRDDSGAVISQPPITIG